jgi:hypothetical protein
MANNSGVQAYWGFGIESTQNTRIVADMWHPFVQESMRENHDPIFSTEIYNDEAFMRAPTPGTQRPSGQVSLDLTPEVCSSLFFLAMGAVATTGAGPYTHVITRNPGALGSFTQHFVRPGMGSLEVWEYIGCMVAGWTVNVRPGQRPNMQLDVLANRVDRTATAISPTFPTMNRLSYTHAGLTVAGTALHLDEITLGQRTGVQGENKITGTNPGSQSVFETGVGSDITGSFTLDYTTATETYYADQLAGTTRALVLTIQLSASASIVFDGDAVFTTDATPNVVGKGKTKQQIGFRLVNGGSNEPTITIVNAEATIT